MRALTLDEARFVAGGMSWTDLGVINVNSNPYDVTNGGSWSGSLGSGGFFPDDNGHDTDTRNLPDYTPIAPPEWLDCEFLKQANVVKPIGHLSNGEKYYVSVPDGAMYFAPESFTFGYMENAIAYLQSFSNSFTEGYTREVTKNGITISIPISARIAEFDQMYLDENHEHFLDIKDLAGPTYEYYSQALGRTIEASAFEAYGNFVYGFVGVAAGIDENILRGAAMLTQEGGTGAEDNAHVELGIKNAKEFAADSKPVAEIFTKDCGDQK